MALRKQKKLAMEAGSGQGGIKLLEPRLPREEEKHPCLLPPLRQKGGQEEDLPLLTLQERYYLGRVFLPWK